MRYYNIEGATNVNGDYQYFDGSLCLDFYGLIEKFKRQVIDQVNEKENKSYVHLGDGEYYFLNKQAIGNSAPGKRHLNISYELLDLEPFKNGTLKNDYICTELNPLLRNEFKKLFQAKIDFPTEIIYGLICSKWFTSTFKNKIGLIGAEPKLEVIKRLIEHDEYQKYLGTDFFVDYIGVPQKFCCDDIDKIEEIIAKQLSDSKSELFLFGIGISKLGLSWRFKKYHKAVYIDIGAGIDCFGGLIDYERPYAAGWTNYRLKEHDYSKLDTMYFKERANDRWI
jgi:hypothetical protein